MLIQIISKGQAKFVFETRSRRKFWQTI